MSSLSLRAMKVGIVCSHFLIPVQKKCAFFCSFWGMYNDNPKKISELLHERMPDLPIYWVKSEKCQENIPDYIHEVKYDSPLFWALVSYAQIVVDGSMGIRRYSVKKNSISAYLKRLFCKKWKKQLCISTWHGTPFKRIGIDFNRSFSGTREEIVFGSSTDYLLAGCEYTKECLLSGTQNKIPVKLYGTPRNDVFFKENIDVAKVKKKLHLPEDKKIILFAPTYRPYSLELSGVKQMETMNVAELLRKCGEKFGGEFVFVFRVHSLVLLDINNRKILEQYGELVVDGNLGDDMADYLVCADILITDYSGSLFDFPLSGKPCFLFAPDKEQYEKDPGTYREYDWLPFPKAYTSKDLINCVENFDETVYKQKVEAFLTELGNVEDGHATERVVQDIVHFIETGRKQ